MGLLGSKYKVEQKIDILDELDLDLNLAKNKEITNDQSNLSEEDIVVDQDHFFMYLKEHKQVENTLDNSFVQMEELFADFQDLTQIKQEFKSHQESNFQNITVKAIKRKELLSLKETKYQARIKKIQDFVTTTSHTDAFKNNMANQRANLIPNKKNKQQYIYRGKELSDQQILYFQFGDTGFKDPDEGKHYLNSIHQVLQEQKKEKT